MALTGWGDSGTEQVSSGEQVGSGPAQLSSLPYKPLLGLFSVSQMAGEQPSCVMKMLERNLGKAKF